ncbi:hypothetical protein A2U01_0052481 [Trifolium medium]|uniref:Uncharacterized protein n=1 Tax=Trifolium medium TaxID=97028 RepID=A0A392R4W4_9FABA|nr:hypothetical protein [Trifolium medium]
MNTVRVPRESLQFLINTFMEFHHRHEIGDPNLMVEVSVFLEDEYNIVGVTEPPYGDARGLKRKVRFGVDRFFQLRHMIISGLDDMVEMFGAVAFS